MRFEGNVAITAARFDVWRALTDVATWGRITPGVLSIETVVPDEQFVVYTGVTVGSQALALPVSVRWTDLLAPERIEMTARSHVGAQAFDVVGHLRLSGEDQTRIAFVADVPVLPKSLPPSLVHSVISKTIRTFFINLKQELEAAAVAPPQPRA